MTWWWKQSSFWHWSQQLGAVSTCKLYSITMILSYITATNCKTSSWSWNHCIRVSKAYSTAKQWLHVYLGLEIYIHLKCVKNTQGETHIYAMQTQTTEIAVSCFDALKARCLLWLTDATICSMVNSVMCAPHILRVPDQNGISWLYNMLKKYHSGPEPSICYT